jgi:succinyl-CoA synthetase beta subunit
MDGNIGCMVNGAGLAMATMDIIQQAGGAPANFLDVGGGANKDQVKKAFQLLLANPSVRAVFINIFGGILRCDVLAQGIVDAVKEVEVRVPVIVRLEGTNVEAGREILKASGLKIVAAADMADGARKAIEAAGLRR